MKKFSFIAAICLVLAATINAQTITPLQLKQARMAAYQWVRDYNVYARMEGKREPAKKFIELFEDESTLLFNDYLPFISTCGETITVRVYSSILSNRDAVYKMSFKIQNAAIVSEAIDELGNIVFVVEFDKTVSFQENGNTSDNLYAYPDKSYHASVRIKYDIKAEFAIAGKITSNAKFEEIIVLHDVEAEFVNKYTTKKELEQVCSENASNLVKWNYAATDFDPQMVYFYQDTIRNFFHFGGAIGLETHYSKMMNAAFTDYTAKDGLYYGFSLGYYRQLMLKNQHRIGLDFSAAFSQSTIGLKAKGYKETYNDTDPDGGNYLRIIDLTSYNETIKRYAVRVPIAIRYDYFIKDNLSLYSKLGVDISYDIAQNAKATAEAQYSGYYDWLFNVTISQNGIYDFGAYNIEGTGKTTGINRLGVGVFAGLGLQYFIPKSNWSLDVAVLYGCEVYNKTSNPDGFHLTETYSNWKSASYLLSSFYGHNIQFQINFNYNF
mgnify:CR=1 FL=1